MELNPIKLFYIHEDGHIYVLYNSQKYRIKPQGYYKLLSLKSHEKIDKNDNYYDPDFIKYYNKEVDKLLLEKKIENLNNKKIVKNDKTVFYYFKKYYKRILFILFLMFIYEYFF